MMIKIEVVFFEECACWRWLFQSQMKSIYDNEQILVACII